MSRKIKDNEDLDKLYSKESDFEENLEEEQKEVKKFRRDFMIDK